MKKFSASVLVAAVLTVVGATAANAADTDVLDSSLVKSQSIERVITIQSGLWPH